MIETVLITGIFAYALIAAYTAQAIVMRDQRSYDIYVRTVLGAAWPGFWLIMLLLLLVHIKRATP